MGMSPNEALEMAVRIVELKKEVSRLHELSRELRNLESRWNRFTFEPSSDDQGLTEEDPTTLVNQIIDLLGSIRGGTLSTEEIQARLPGSNMNSVRSAVVRLAKVGRIQRSDRGQYGVGLTSVPQVAVESTTEE